MRVIAVGDDDQNIYDFRGSDSRFFRSLLSKYEATQYELTENFRSAPQIVSIANDYAASISVRMKTKPAFAHRKTPGEVTLIHHRRPRFEKAIVKEDENEAWSAPLFVTMLKAYGIEKDDLLIIGRKVIEESKNYIIETRNTHKEYQKSKKIA